jgi:hypothetical protein
MILLPHEVIILRIISVFTLCISVIVYMKGYQLPVVIFCINVLLALCFIGIGQLIRRSSRQIDNRDAESALITIFGILIALKLIFGFVITSLFPISFPRIDHILIQIDSIFGFQWQEVVTYFSHIPYSSEIMSPIYQSISIQVLVIIIALSYTNRMHELGIFLLTGILGVLICLAVWFLFPSFGPASVYDLPDDVLARMPIGADPDYGKYLEKLSVEGLEGANRSLDKGTVAFPSYHMTLALMCVAFSRPFKKLWPFFIALNILMVPCIIVQGGHHLIDLFGGIALFFVAYICSVKLMHKVSAPVTNLGSESEAATVI